MSVRRRRSFDPSGLERSKSRKLLGALSREKNSLPAKPEGNGGNGPSWSASQESFVRQAYGIGVGEGAPSTVGGFQVTVHGPFM
jgi:hypothetical protein